jgi:hypothetical protein
VVDVLADQHPGQQTHGRQAAVDDDRRNGRLNLRLIFTIHRRNILPDPVAQRISQVPTDSHQNNGFFDAAAFEAGHVRPLLSIWPEKHFT